MTTGKHRAMNAYSKVVHPGGKNLDAAEREKLILEYSPLIRYVAGRIAMRLPSHLSLDDLISAGVLGLIDAVDKYNPSRNAKFKTYAEYRIRGSILDELRALDWIPRSVRKKSHRLEQAHSQLAQEFGREPDEGEVASKLGLSLEKYFKMVDETSGLGLFALVDPDSNASQFVPGTILDSALKDEADSPEQLFDKEEIKTVIAEAIERLKVNEQLVVSLYYYDELTMKEIGKVLGYTESRICQIHSQTMIRLRSRLRRYFAELT